MPPTTPSKADDGIERTKQLLAARWNLHFPVRDTNWSPSKKDPTSLAEKVHGLIQYLYFRKEPSLGALDYSIGQFEAQAPLILSQWQFKPHADLGVIPTRREPSELSRDFLHRRHRLSDVALEQLMQCLHHHLSLVADRVKRGEDYIAPAAALSSIENVGLGHNDTGFGRTRKGRAPVGEIKYRQSTLSQAFRSKSDPTIQHASSDDFMDDDISEVLQDVCMPDAGPLVSVVTKIPSKKSSGHTSSVEETFETPPTTPPHKKLPFTDRQENRVDSHIDYTKADIFRKPGDPPVTRKRPLPEPEKAIQPRKLSRESSRSGPMSYTSTVDNAKRHSLSTTVIPNYERLPRGLNPSVPLGSSWDSTRSTATSKSFDSSITAASSILTSPNTSFSTVSTNSRSASFDQKSEDTDSTIRTSLVRTRLQSPERRGHGQMAGRADSERQPDQGKSIVDSHESEGRRVKESISKRLASYPPFANISDAAVVPFRQVYEVSRIATFLKLPLINFQFYLTKPFDNYNELWLGLGHITRNLGLVMPERSSLIAWEKAASTFEGVSLTGKLRFLDTKEGPLLDLLLHPMRMEASYRLARKYGSDRFCVLGLPGLGAGDLPSYLKNHDEVARDAIICWLVDTEHVFLGRQWRAFYTKPDSKKSEGGVRNSLTDSRYRVYFFAEDGLGFRQGPRKGEVDPRLPDRPRQTVKQLLEWFMPSQNNLDQPCLKFFARLALGLSSNTPTIEIRPQELIRSDDARSGDLGERRLDVRRSEEKKTQRNGSASKAPIMNDGCARISRPAALAVANMLGLDEPPSIFQGRIAGAKGVWMVDCLDEMPTHLAHPQSREFWIEITDAQLKFNSPGVDALAPDPARMTFEVNNFSTKLTPSFLNFQLMPILLDRGVPKEVFERLLQEDLTAKVADMEMAMENGLALRKWNQQNGSVAHERAEYGGIELQGGMPVSRAEKINWFVEHGFEPKQCYYLKEQLYKAIHGYCLRLENRMNIGLGRSTNAFMIADPLGVLEPGEIHLGFSNSFRDPKSEFNETMLHNLDVLVARSPAHLPSDIQKVRAVFKLELRIYRDVVVFSSKGQMPLASKLSGGDYDGDKAWICWDPCIVEPFENAEVPPHPSFEYYGIEKDETRVSDLLSHDDYTDRFLRHAFDFNLRTNLLGTCTIYHEAFCYAKNAIDSPQAIEIAVLLGLLVDSAKGGFRFDDTKWTAFLKKLKLPKKMPPPAYKPKSKTKLTQHLIDTLVFKVAKGARQKALGHFAKHFADVPRWDEDLVRIRNGEVEESKGNHALAQVLRNLDVGLGKIHGFWQQHARREEEDDDWRPPTDKKSDSLSFKALIEQCRADFLALSPIGDTETTHDSTIRRWQNDHRRGQSGYWDLVKASVAFSLYFKTNFVWYIAGVELGEIKATAKGRGNYRAVVNNVFESFRVDGKLIDGIRRREMEGILGVSDSVLDHDAGDEFGEWDWWDEV